MSEQGGEWIYSLWLLHDQSAPVCCGVYMICRVLSVCVVLNQYLGSLSPSSDCLFPCSLLSFFSNPPTAVSCDLDEPAS